MAHFAQLDENNRVLQVAIIAVKGVISSYDEESERIGVAFLERGQKGKWVQTFPDKSFRKHFAQREFIYDPVNNEFNPPASWIFNEGDGVWEAPVDIPDAQNKYRWDEPTLSWVLSESE